VKSLKPSHQGGFFYGLTYILSKGEDLIAFIRISTYFLARLLRRNVGTRLTGYLSSHDLSDDPDDYAYNNHNDNNANGYPGFEYPANNLAAAHRK
jgi:hypothetical protein